MLSVWLATGVPARLGASLLAIALSKIDPRTAMPVATPTRRKGEWMPGATPLRGGGTTPSAVEGSAGLTSPTPAPPATKPASSAVQCESAESPRISNSPAPTSPSPPPSSSRTGTRADRLPDTADTANATTVTGRNRRPVCSGDNPRIVWRYRVRYRNIANIEDESVNAAIDAPPKVGLRNSVRSNIALSWTVSAITNAASSRADAANRLTISVLLQ